jgi:hypothetical protein
VSGLSGEALVHRERAERLNRHASDTRKFGTREMYLRLAETEIGLAEWLERLDQQAREQAGTGEPTPTVPEASPQRDR